MARKAIEALIKDEAYKEGDRLPSKTSLAKSFGLGLRPVQQALETLAQEGILKNVRGSGCYLNSSPKVDFNEEIIDDMLATNIYADYLSSINYRIPQKVIRIGLDKGEYLYFSKQWQHVLDSFCSSRNDISVEIVNSRVPNVTSFSDETDIFQIPASLLPHFVNKEVLFNFSETEDVALNENEFFTELLKAASYKGKRWGIPLISASNCNYFNREFESPLKPLSEANGFWESMEILELVARKNNVPEALVINTNPMFLLMRLAGLDCAWNWTDIEKLEDESFYIFLERFRQYYQNSSIFFNKNSEYTSTPYQDFFNRNGHLILGSSCWLPNIYQSSPFPWGITQNIREKNANSQIITMLNVISSKSSYPFECAEILKYLGTYEVQNYFAQNGRIVANKKAFRNFHLNGTDNNSIKNVICDAMENGKVESIEKPQLAQYLMGTINYDFQKWQRKELNTKKLLTELKGKIALFTKSKKALVLC
jgi:DNA-binding transcriptional regulator YhcF (GntR family)